MTPLTLRRLQGAGSVLDTQDKFKRSLQGLQDFFKFHKLESSKESQKYGDKKHLPKEMGNCQKCRQMIKFNSKSRWNLKKHYIMVSDKLNDRNFFIVSAPQITLFKSKVFLKKFKCSHLFF